MLNIMDITKSGAEFTITTEENKTYRINYANGVVCYSYTGRAITRLPSMEKRFNAEDVDNRQKLNAILSILKTAISQGSVTNKLMALDVYYNFLDRVNMYDLVNGNVPTELPKGYIKWIDDNHKKINNSSLREYMLDCKVKTLTKDEARFVNNLRHLPYYYAPDKSIEYIKLPDEVRKKVFAVVKNSCKNFEFNLYDQFSSFMRYIQIPIFASHIDTNRDIEHNISAFIELENRKRNEKILVNEAKISRISELSNDEYTIVVPSSMEEFTDEGKQQNNCVGHYYHDNIAEGKDLVYFIRRANAPKKSYVTCRYNTQKNYTVEHRFKNNHYEDELGDFRKEIDRFIRQLLGVEE